MTEVNFSTFLSVLVSLGCHNKNNRDWVAYKQQKLTPYNYGDWKSDIRVPAWLNSHEGSFPGCRLPTFYCLLTWWRSEKGSKLTCDSYKGTNPIHEDSTLITSSNPSYLSEAPPVIPSH